MSTAAFIQTWGSIAAAGTVLLGGRSGQGQRSGSGAGRRLQHHARHRQRPGSHGYVPWELDESSLFKDLPAGGRLAYAYRIIPERPVSARYVRVRCASRQGWGMLLSEIQVFDTVHVDTNVPPLVVHPPIARRPL